nr:MAG TPA: hypothetical protein [Caudoviricetes sp.]
MSNILLTFISIEYIINSLKIKTFDLKALKISLKLKVLIFYPRL